MLSELKMTKRQDDIINNLKSFRDITGNRRAHLDLLKEKKIILYAATLLENDDIQILELCLEILENFVANESAHAFLLSTFGVYEAVEALSIRMRNGNESIHKRTTEITEILRNSAPPAYNTRYRTKSNKPVKKNHLFLIFIEDLEKDNQVKLENALLKIRGIISFLMDIELRRCTLRICPKLTIKQVIEKIYIKSDLKAVVVTKNFQEGTEMHYDVLQQTIDKSYLEYPEEEFFSKGKSIATTATNFVKNSNGLFKSVTHFLNESFYW